MTPKLAKMKKESLALVVSTPTVDKGEKKKAQGDSNKGKGNKRKGLQLNGRWIDYDFFDSYNFEFS